MSLTSSVEILKRCSVLVLKFSSCCIMSRNILIAILLMKGTFPNESSGFKARAWNHKLQICVLLLAVGSARIKHIFIFLWYGSLWISEACCKTSSRLQFLVVCCWKRWCSCYQKGTLYSLLSALDLDHHVNSRHSDVALTMEFVSSKLLAHFNKKL